MTQTKTRTLRFLKDHFLFDPAHTYRKGKTLSITPGHEIQQAFADYVIRNGIAEWVPEPGVITRLNITYSDPFPDARERFKAVYGPQIEGFRKALGRVEWKEDLVMDRWTLNLGSPEYDNFAVHVTQGPTYAAKRYRAHVLGQPSTNTFETLERAKAYAVRALRDQLISGLATLPDA